MSDKYYTQSEYEQEIGESLPFDINQIVNKLIEIIETELQGEDKILGVGALFAAAAYCEAKAIDEGHMEQQTEKDLKDIAAQYEAMVENYLANGRADGWDSWK